MALRPIRFRGGADKPGSGTLPCSWRRGSDSNARAALLRPSGFRPAPLGLSGTSPVIIFDGTGAIFDARPVHVLAAGVRFGLTKPCGFPGFKAGAIDHSANPPNWRPRAGTRHPALPPFTARHTGRSCRRSYSVEGCGHNRSAGLSPRLVRAKIGCRPTRSFKTPRSRELGIALGFRITPTGAIRFVQGSAVFPMWWDWVGNPSFATACYLVENIGIGPIASCLQSISVPQHIPLHQVCARRPLMPAKRTCGVTIPASAASHRSPRRPWRITRP